MYALEKIGIVGTGRMGSNMALRLRDVGYDITALYDANPAAARAAAVETGGRVCETLAEVTANADVILTVVSDDAAMDAIFSETGDTLARGRRRQDVHQLRDGLARRPRRGRAPRATGAARNALEACMAARITQAREGTLYLMCGGKPRGRSNGEPMLEKLSSSLRYIGGAGRRRRRSRRSSTW